MNPLAGETLAVVWDAEQKAFKPADGSGPVFTIRTLSYWDCQKVLAETTDEDKVSKCLELGVVAIDADDEKAKAFLITPKACLVNPLFTAIWENSWGN